MIASKMLRAEICYLSAHDVGMYWSHFLTDNSLANRERYHNLSPELSEAMGQYAYYNELALGNVLLEAS